MDVVDEIKKSAMMGGHFMAQVDNNALQALFMDREVPSGDDATQLEYLQHEVRKLGLWSRVGWVLHAGEVYDGSFQVQFNLDGSEGYSSRWPEWAYRPALQSMLHGKSLWVVSDGVPYGRNLVQVLVMRARR